MFFHNSKFYLISVDWWNTRKDNFYVYITEMQKIETMFPVSVAHFDIAEFNHYITSSECARLRSKYETWDWNNEQNRKKWRLRSFVALVTGRNRWDNLLACEAIVLRAIQCLYHQSLRTKGLVTYDPFFLPSQYLVVLIPAVQQNRARSIHRKGFRESHVGDAVPLCRVRRFITENLCNN